MKKKLLVAFMILCFSTLMYGCGNSTNSPSSDDKNYNSPIDDADKELSESEIESKVVSALYSEVGRKYDTADPGSCRYSINKTERNGNGKYTVYGEVTLIDKYGKTTGGWADGSGTAFRRFTVTINSSGSTSCTIE